MTLLVCAKCGATLSEEKPRTCPSCDAPRALSQMERFARVYAAHVAAGYPREAAAKIATPIARSKVEA